MKEEGKWQKGVQGVHLAGGWGQEQDGSVGGKGQDEGRGLEEGVGLAEAGGCLMSIASRAVSGLLGAATR